LYRQVELPTDVRKPGQGRQEQLAFSFVELRLKEMLGRFNTCMRMRGTGRLNIVRVVAVGYVCRQHGVYIAYKILRELNKTGIDKVKLYSMPRNYGVVTLMTCGQ
jgi:hypothetical protein